MPTFYTTLGDGGRHKNIVVYAIIKHQQAIVRHCVNNECGQLSLEE